MSQETSFVPKVVVETLETLPHPFDTKLFGVATTHPLLKSLDWLEKHRNEEHLVKSVRSYLQTGVRSRKERFGEVIGRAISGYWREPQNEIHIHDPHTVLRDQQTQSPKENWKNFFSSPKIQKNGYLHALYALIDSEGVQQDSYKGRFSVLPDTVPLEERGVKAFFIRSERFSKESLQEILTQTQKAGIPLIDIATLSLIEN